MAIEREPVKGVGEQPPVSFSPQPPEATQLPTVEDLATEARNILSSDAGFVAWAGPNWRTLGLKQNGLSPNRYGGKDFSYFGSVPQGGPALFLKVRVPNGEGFLFQKGNPNSNSEAGKKEIHKLWDKNGNELNIEDPLERAERTRKIFQELFSSELSLVA